MKIFTTFILLILSLNLAGQAPQLHYHNTPQSDFRYHFRPAELMFSKSTVSGPSVVWDFSSLNVLSPDSSVHFTRNPDYPSFPGIPHTQYPDPLDTTFLYSDNAIYRVTDTLYSKAYFKCPSSPFDTTSWIVQEIDERLLVFPFSYGQIMDTSSIDGYTWQGLPCHSVFSKRSDAWGALILPDTTYTDVLRIYTFENHYVTNAYHSYSGASKKVYDYYISESEVPFITVTFSDDYQIGLSGESHSYDSTAIIFTGKQYSPFNNIDPSDITIQGVKLYPNPAQDIIFLEVPWLFPGSTFVVYNSLGQKIFSGSMSMEKIKIDVSGLTKGVYVVRLQSDYSVATGKFVKN